MRRAPGTCAQPPSEDRLPTMPLARRRAFAPERMMEPGAECPFILALLTRCRDSVSKLRRLLLILPNGLPTEIRTLCGLLERVTFLQSPDYPSVFPMPVHRGEIALNPACRPSCVRNLQLAEPSRAIPVAKLLRVPLCAGTTQPEFPMQSRARGMRTFPPLLVFFGALRACACARRW